MTALNTAGAIAEELHVAAERLVGQRIEQGFGERVDRATLARIAVLIGELPPETTKTPGHLVPSVFISSGVEDGHAAASTPAA
jgi:hypothetical protein